MQSACSGEFWHPDGPMYGICASRDGKCPKNWSEASCVGMREGCVNFFSSPSQRINDLYMCETSKTGCPTEWNPSCKSLSLPLKLSQPAPEYARLTSTCRIDDATQHLSGAIKVDGIDDCARHCKFWGSSDGGRKCTAFDTDGKTCYLKASCDGEEGACKDSWCGYRMDASLSQYAGGPASVPSSRKGKTSDTRPNPQLQPVPLSPAKPRNETPEAIQAPLRRIETAYSIDKKDNIVPEAISFS